MLNAIKNGTRVLIEAELAPVQGARFQPTGFADIGAGVYRLADGTRMLLVESAQSMANRLEAAAVGPDNEIVPALQGLSYIRAKLNGDADTTTTSLVEAHRINSPFIISDKEFQASFCKEADYAKGRPLDWRKIAAALFKFDVNSILHGAFLANLEDGRIKMPRAVSAFIEARNVQEAVSGGVKNNPFDPSGKLRAEGYTKDVYGNVPYHRIEWTAENVTAFFNLDSGLLLSYDLPEPAFDLLVTLALFKIRSLLDGGLRLRTACDLKIVSGPTVTEPEGLAIPPSAELLDKLKELIGSCSGLFADPPVTEIGTKVKWMKKSGDSADAEAD
jgi:CRISPR-associated protein Csb1